MDYSRFNDIELIELAAGETSSYNEAFNTIFLKYMSQLYGYCIFKSNCKTDAEDLMQETWINFYRSIKSGKKTNNIIALLLTVAKNLSIDRYRKEKRIDTIKYDDNSSPGINNLADPFNFQNEIEKKEMLKLLEGAVHNLDEIYKETVLLYWFGEMTFSEIAKLLGESEACIRRRFERASKQLLNFFIANNF